MLEPAIISKVLLAAIVDPKTGDVSLIKNHNMSDDTTVKWRRVIVKGDAAGLDTWAPELSAGERQAIIDKWAAIP